jgi:hypothetical protein
MPTDPWTQGVVFGVILCLGMYAVGYIVYRWLKIWLIRRGSLFENPFARETKAKRIQRGAEPDEKENALRRDAIEQEKFERGILRADAAAAAKNSDN